MAYGLLGLSLLYGLPYCPYGLLIESLLYWLPYCPYGLLVEFGSYGLALRLPRYFPVCGSTSMGGPALTRVAIIMRSEAEMSFMVLPLRVEEFLNHHPLLQAHHVSLVAKTAHFYECSEKYLHCNVWVVRTLCIP